MALVFVGATSPAALAVESREEMTIAPTDKHYSVNPGETITDNFTILNSGDVPYDFTTYAAPYSVSDTVYNADSTTQGNRSDAFRWIQFDKTSFHAEVRESVKVPFTIRVSPFATPGGHYGIIFAEQKLATKAEGTGVTRTIRMGMVIYVNVKGNAKTEGSLGKSSIAWYQPSAPITGEILVNNTGETDFQAKASFVVSDLFGNVKYTQKFNELYVLPGSPRLISFNWDKSPWLGIFKVQMGVSFLDTTKVTESYVFVLPRWLLFVGGIVILLGAIRAVRALSNRPSKRR